MKKKSILIIGVAAFGAVLTYNVSENLHGSSLSGITLANIEALAMSEEPATKYTCETKIVTKKGVKTFTCGPCDWVDNMAAAWDSSTSTCTK